MSLLPALGPVQAWLGQELEKCGIDAMVYTRYVLSLLLRDGCDRDLQEQLFIREEEERENATRSSPG